jgi:regulator of RNase E activity RraB
VGRLTCAGKRDFYFYSKDDKFGWDDLSDFFNMYPSYKFAVGAREEKNWSTYDDFLYPSSPEEYQYILNQQIVGKLSAEGDSLLDPRNVDHWIYFDEKAKADLFQQEIIAEGFSVEKSEIANEESGKVRLVASRIDRVDFPNINDVVQYLIAVAKKFEGQYDGWETKVLK